MRHHRFWAGLLALCWAVSCVGGADVRFDTHSVRSGRWSDSQTWAEQHVPGAGDRIQVRPGHVVTYDAASDDPIRMIHVAGVLTFSRERSTKLCVGLIKIQAGNSAGEEGFDCDARATDEQPSPGGSDAAALEIGTAQSPIPSGVTATISLVYFPGTDQQTLPAIIDCGGRWDVHGAPMKRTWVKLGATARAGDDTVRIAEDPEGWRVGDRLLLTGSYTDEFRPHGRPREGSEERVIASIDGTSVKLDRPLAGDHVAGGHESTEAADLSRNVVIESAHPDGIRGHTIYRRNSRGGISYAEFRHLGKQGVLGKYPIHFHLVRDSMRGTAVIGASIWDSRNRFMAIHGTDYLLVRDCVGYRCIGHGFFLEDATEQYNILDRNLAVGAIGGKPLPDQVLDFDQNEGAGFWCANGRNTLTRNVACENGMYGFRFQIERSHGRDPLYSGRQPDGTDSVRDIRTIPFLRLEDNEAHGDGLYAFDLGDDPPASVHTDRRDPFIARDLRAWQSHYALRSNTTSFLMDGLRIDHAVYGVYHPDYNDQVYRNVYLNTVNAEPINRGHDDESIQYGSFTYDHLTLENCRLGRDPLIQLTCTSPVPGQTGHFRDVTIINSNSPTNVVDLGGGPRNEKLENGVVYYFHEMPKAGRAMRVVSVHFPSLMTGGSYRSVPRFTGPDVRAAEVPGVPFPLLLDPVDDLPPATIITAVQRRQGAIIVRGTSEDNGRITRVSVNGRGAQIVASHAGVTDWEISLDPPADGVIQAFATDDAGNVERTPAAIRIPRAAGPRTDSRATSVPFWTSDS